MSGDSDDDSELGTWTGLPLDLPPGQHPFDGYLSALTNILGWRKTATYLGYTIVEGHSEDHENE
jgi:hypothetical protein